MQVAIQGFSSFYFFFQHFPDPSDGKSTSRVVFNLVCYQLNYFTFTVPRFKCVLYLVDALQNKMLVCSRTFINYPVGGTPHGTKDTPGILSNGELRPFWLTWRDRHLRFGEGEEVGQNEVTSYNNLQLDAITSASVSSGGSSAGEWLFKPTPPTLGVQDYKLLFCEICILIFKKYTNVDLFWYNCCILSHQTLGNI